MARTTTQPARYADIPAAQLPGSIVKLERRLADILEVPAPADNDEVGLRAEAICTRSNELYREIFGPDSLQAREAYTHTTTFYLMYGPTPWGENLGAFEGARRRVAARIETTIALLKEKLAEVGSAAPSAPPSAPADAGPANGPVFLVHGHDSPAKVEVARVLERAGLEVTILHEQPNRGATIIEKLERHGGAAGFAVVLLTPDDHGGPMPVLASRSRPRARQNVLLELGWFAGKLGRDRVCALKKGDIEVPSDFSGVGYVDMDDRGAWKAELLKELDGAGYTVDWRKGMA
jgi:predicted nucleotide-binding protein